MAENKFGFDKDILNLLNKDTKKKETELKPDIKSDKLQEEDVKNLQEILDAKDKKISDKNPDKNLPAVRVNVAGIAINSENQITKTEYFKNLDLDMDKYGHLTFTPEQAKKINMAITSLSTGLSAAIPMLCTADACPFKTTCPYMEANQAPLGLPCLVEKQLINYWVKQYIEEFQVDFNSITEIRMVSELAEFDVYELRVTKFIAENHPALLQEVTVSFDDAGNPITNEEISRAFDLKERIKRARMRVLDALVATRKDKIKLLSETISGTSTSEKINNLKTKVEELSRAIGENTVVVEGNFSKEN